MFTHTLIQKSFKDGVWRNVVRFTDGTSVFDENYAVNSLDELKKRIQFRIEQLNKMETEFATITENQPLTLPVKEEVAPTPEEIAKAKLTEAYELFQKKVMSEEEYNSAVTAYKLAVSGK